MKEYKKEVVAGVEYSLPEVTLLQSTGIGVAEVAGRTCYDSFGASENEAVVKFQERIEAGDETYMEINEIESSDLLDNLAWVYHHHSIIEHAVVSYRVKNVSRGVLQEHARHRLQSISVRSSRYVLGNVMNAYVAVRKTTELISDARMKFQSMVGEGRPIDILVVTDREQEKIEAGTIFDKLYAQELVIGQEEFISLAIAKSSIPFLEEQYPTSKELFDRLEAGKSKRNVGDPFKHIVSDNWKTEMIITFNIRSLKNYIDLRSAGSAWFQIRWLANAIIEATPEKYLALISKKHRYQH